MWKLSQPSLPGIASRNRSNNNSWFFFYRSKCVSSATFCCRSHASGHTSSGDYPQVPVFKVLKQNFFAFEDLTDDSSHTAEEELIKRHNDYRIKTKSPAATGRLGESTGSIRTNSNFCFSWAKHHISLFWMLMRAVTKL